MESGELFGTNNRILKFLNSSQCSLCGGYIFASFDRMAEIDNGLSIHGN